MISALMRVQNMACGVPVQSKQMEFRLNAIIACIIAEIAVILRIYSKVTILGKLGIDDYFIMIAAVGWPNIVLNIFTDISIVCYSTVHMACLQT